MNELTRPDSDSDPLDGIDLDDISMSFGTNQVLRGVSMHLESGRITALIGANGAGKSTLIKILSGVHHGYTGSIRVDGEERSIGSIAGARQLGIETVHQRIDEGVVPGLSVAENLLFDRITSGEVARVASMRRLLPLAREITATLQLDWSTAFLRTDVFEIGLADQQLLLLARALSRRPRLLILDEPTSALGVKQSGVVLKYIRQAKERGIAVVFITHNPHHAFMVGDRFYLLNRGGLTNEFVKGSVAREDLVQAMAGGAELEALAHELESNN